MKRSLSLRRETLAELTDLELGDVAGAYAKSIVGSCPIAACLQISREQFNTCDCQTATSC